MNDNIDAFAIIDRRRSADLDDVGGAGWTVAVAIDSDGAEHLGVIHRSAIGNPNIGFGTGCTPAHEQLGALGLGTKRAIALGQNITQHQQDRSHQNDRHCYARADAGHRRAASIHRRLVGVAQPLLPGTANRIEPGWRSRGPKRFAGGQRRQPLRDERESRVDRSASPFRQSELRRCPPATFIRGTPCRATAQHGAQHTNRRYAQVVGTKVITKRLAVSLLYARCHGPNEMCNIWRAL